MNQRLISVLAFAFVVSAGASLLLYRLLSPRVGPQKTPPSAQVIVAAETLKTGTLIKDSDLRVSNWVETIPPGAIRTKQETMGRGVLSTIYAGEPIVDSRLAPKGAGAGLAALIPKGMRAVALRVNEIVGVAGFAVPGMHVDVLISGSPPGSSALGGVTRTLLQDVEVLSAGQNFQKDLEGKPISVQVVNLLVTPEQAEMLSLASTQATIQLVLRNPLDSAIAKTTGSAFVQLFHPDEKLPLTPLPSPIRPKPAAVRRPAPPPVSPPPAPRVVEVIQGVKRTEVEFTSRAGGRP